MAKGDQMSIEKGKAEKKRREVEVEVHESGCSTGCSFDRGEFAWRSVCLCKRREARATRPYSRASSAITAIVETSLEAAGNVSLEFSPRRHASYDP